MNSSVFLDMGTKLRPLLRQDFSAFESGRFSGIQECDGFGFREVLSCFFEDS